MRVTVRKVDARALEPFTSGRRKLGGEIGTDGGHDWCGEEGEDAERARERLALSALECRQDERRWG